MKEIDDLVASAAELAERGYTRGEIADELNVSRETASWLVDRGGVGATASDDHPHDVHVDWSPIGRDGDRLGQVGAAISSLLAEAADADVTVGVEKAGVPLATVVARTLGTDLAAYAPRKHLWEEGDLDDLDGSFSHNFARIDGRDCYVVDDTITSGTTMRETVEAVRGSGGTPVACAVLADKRGIDEIGDVPVGALLRVIRMGEGT